MIFNKAKVTEMVLQQTDGIEARLNRDFRLLEDEILENLEKQKNNLDQWCLEQNNKNDERQKNHDRHLEDQKHHMQVVESYLKIQVEILSKLVGDKPAELFSTDPVANINRMVK